MGTEGNITKDGDDFIRERCGTDSRSDDNIHALLRVIIDLVENGKQLSPVNILRQFSVNPSKVRGSDITFWAHVKAKTWIGNVETKLGVILMRCISPGGIIPFNGWKWHTITIKTRYAASEQDIQHVTSFYVQASTHHRRRERCSLYV